MTSTLLSRLLNAGLVHLGDKVTFRFKQHRYSATIAAGGMLTACQMDCSRMPGVFDDLQTWCDDCIYDHGGDCVARFSSTKRVKHAPTGRSLAVLKQELRSHGTSGTSGTGPCMCAESTAQQRRVLELEQQVQELKKQLHAGQAASAGDGDESDDDNPFRLKF